MHTRLITAACLLLAVVALAAQDQSARDSQLPTFRTETDLVRVDMYATKGDELITDLRADEVEIFEDNVRQRIDTFEFVRVAGGAAGSGADVEGPSAAEPVSADARSRVFVVFIDTYTTRLENNKELRRALVRFLDELLGPTDLVALMTPDMLASEIALGRRATVISDLANDARWTTADDRPPDQNEFAWENCYSARGRGAGMRARYQGKATIDALTDLVTHLRTLREERKAVLLVTGGWPFADDLRSSTGTTTLGETDRCAKDRAALERTDFPKLLRELSRTANRANVSFYPVSSRQERVFPREMPAVMKQQARQRDKIALETVQGQLRTLATQTDGMAEVKTTNLAAVTERILSDTSAYYLVGYQSTNAKADRRYRMITIRVSRPGIRVRNRPGYGGEAPSPRAVLAAEAAARKPIVDGRVLTALSIVEHFDTRAPFWGRSSSWESSSGEEGGSFWYVGEIGLETRLQSAWNAGAKAEVEVIASDKTKVMTQVVDLKASESTFFMRVPAEGTLPPGNYSVRVRLRPATSDGSLAVHDTIRVTLDPASSTLGEAVFWRRGPSARAPYEETADPRFRRVERMRLELPTASEEEATVRLLDRQGRPLQTNADITQRPDPSSLFQWLVVEAPIAALAPGDYAIEVTQKERSRVTAFRVIP